MQKFTEEEQDDKTVYKYAVGLQLNFTFSVVGIRRQG